MIEGAIYKDDKVAVMYYQPIPKVFNIGGNDYVTDVQRGVAMIFVPEEDVPAALAYMGGCCGGKRHVFHLPSQEAFNIHQTGHR